MEMLKYFTELIRTSYTEKKKKNPRLSLRRYASLLGLSPSFLSELINGKSNLSASKMSILIDNPHLNH